MNACTEIASRLRAIEWNDKPVSRKSQARLVQEYLRRSALWTGELRAQGWPFLDIAHRIDPDVRAPVEIVDGALAAFPSYATYYVRRTVEWSLHFAALKDAGKPLPALPDPFSPLLLVYERGDTINLTPTGSIEVAGLSVPRGEMHRYARIEPLSAIDRESLDRLDQ
ncbi:hypothetical protein DFP74_3095 [Nocardiopsis sp. Huas11]|uniref:hypothetical protein n=1 Tax=Nocardiopsis sp. Huas11 TaxID=2183912 RepID=UPI000EAE74A6|nr:hypothetical protein [Nocardiopsis sp. Huas11]RKS07426.1 hypothetical protein DFP74_3095 [Nocardiopsis sp. Huas11]